MIVCLYSCRCYPACKTHLFCAALCCHVWPVWLYRVFSHYLINSTNFRNQVTNIQCVFWFSVQLFSETIHHLRRIHWDIVHYTLHSIHYTLHVTQYTLHTIHTTHYTVHTTHTTHTTYYTYYTLHSIHYTLHSIRYTLHSIRYTLHIKHYTLHMSSCKVPLILIRLQSHFTFIKRFSKNLNHKISWHSIGNRVVPCWQTDGQTDMTKLIVTLHSPAIVAEEAVFRAVISDVNIWRHQLLLSVRSTTL